MWSFTFFIFTTELPPYWWIVWNAADSNRKSRLHFINIFFQKYNFQNSNKQIKTAGLIVFPAPFPVGTRTGPTHAGSRTSPLKRGFWLAGTSYSGKVRALASLFCSSSHHFGWCKWHLSKKLLCLASKSDLSASSGLPWRHGKATGCAIGPSDQKGEESDMPRTLPVPSGSHVDSPQLAVFIIIVIIIVVIVVVPRRFIGGSLLWEKPITLLVYFTEYQ